MCRHESENVLELLVSIADDSDFSTDSEEEELELLYMELAFSSKREKGSRFSIDDCSEVDFELLFR